MIQKDSGASHHANDVMQMNHADDHDGDQGYVLD
jgi:hypothetical protein